MSSDFKLTLLGTGSPWFNPEHYGPSILIEASNKTLVFDFGRGTATRLAQLELLGKADTLFLTHLHSDHIVGLPDLYLAGCMHHHSLYSDEPSFGFRIEFDGKSMVISGDTRYCENLIKYSEGVDLLVHECALLR